MHVCVWVWCVWQDGMRAQPKPGNTCLSMDQPPSAGGVLETTPQRRGRRTAPHIDPSARCDWPIAGD